MTKRTTAMPQPSRLLTRILELPDLAREVRSLTPGALHRLIRKCGLEDSGEIIALATTEQLMRIFDEDLWSGSAAGSLEEFDAGRFGLWLEVLAEMGTEVAARKIAEMDFEFVAAAMSRQILVLDFETVLRGRIMAGIEGDDFEAAPQTWDSTLEKAMESSLSHEFNGFTVFSKRDDSWDAVLSVLMSLEDGHHDFFRRLLDRCSHISTEYIEDNGGLFEVLTAGEQVMEDEASRREERREREGYVTPVQAAAFLALARQTRTGDSCPPPAPDHVTAGYFRTMKKRETDGSGPLESGHPVEPREEPCADTGELPETVLITILREMDDNRNRRQPLLLESSAGAVDRTALIRNRLSVLRQQDASIYAQRMKELGYLANVLMAGCSFQSRRFRTGEAADAVLAACNLGLENWPVHWRSDRPGTAINDPLPPDFLRRHDLVTAFRIGWSRLHSEVSLLVGQRLVEALAALRCDDGELQGDLRELGLRLALQVEAGAPWRERDNLDVLAILDQPCWAVLLGLLDECPVLPEAAESGASSRERLRLAGGFEFISENRQLLQVRDFLEDLPRRLLE